MLRLYNTLTRKIEEFKPLNPPQVGLYTCGMTVYYNAHIGHGRKYTMDDILRRTLTLLGYKVTHVQNVTDVGHLTSDADEGEDKMEKGAEMAGKTVWEVAEFFTNNFYETMDKLNVLRPNVICKATDHIPEQIELIKKIIANGYGYDTPEAVYFDVTKFDDYGILTGQNLEDKKTAVREEVKTGEYKKHSADFALWFKRVGRFENHTMHWASPWGDGFPGWHIECSAMSMKYLGETFDIHTGGIDHIPVHHTNEIAQSEAATGKLFVKYWIHYEFLRVNGVKMSKSLGNFYTIEDVIKKGFDPIALRYFYLTAHYKKPINFTWEALGAAQTTLNRLKDQIRVIVSEVKVAQSNKIDCHAHSTTLRARDDVNKYKQQFTDALEDDLNTPQALSLVWEVIKSDLHAKEKLDLLIEFDKVLGLELGKDTDKDKGKIPQEVQELISKRENAREEKNFTESDRLRNEIGKMGYTVKDTPDGQKVRKN